MSVVRWLKSVATLAIVGVLVTLAGLALWAWARGHPGDVPWTPLDITRPPGAFTPGKLARLRDMPGTCEEQLSRAGVRFTALPPRTGAQCGYEDGVRLRAGGPLDLRFSPAGLGTSCPVAAGLAVWSWNGLQAAARETLGSQVATVEHFGSFSCRRLYGRESGPWSEHATANALDVAGFVLADGRRISVARDWSGEDDEALFLHAARDAACDSFTTVLSPDYNAAHRDHLHLDMVRRGFGSACR